MSCSDILLVVTTPILGLFVIFLLLIWHWRGWRVYWMLRGVPSLTPVPLIGDAIYLASAKRQDIFKLMAYQATTARYKKAFLLGLPSVLLHHPDDVEIILGSMTNIKKGYEYTPVKPWLNNGLLVSDGKKWHQRRKLLTPSFHFSILEDNVVQVARHTKVFIQRLLETNGEPIILEDLVRHYTLDVICETAMGINLDAQENKSKDYVNAIKRCLHELVRRCHQIWLYKDWIYGLTTAGKVFFKDIETLHKFTEQKCFFGKKLLFHSQKFLSQPDPIQFDYLYKVIDKRKATFEQQKEKITKRKAFLDLLLETEEKNPGVLTSKGIREEVDTFMFEGHDTTSAAIVHGLFALANNPKVQERLFEEQQLIFGSDRREPTKNDLLEMTYLDMFIKEVLRLYPSVPFISRTLTEDLKLGDGRVLPAGVNLAVIPFIIHRLKEYWDNPEEFRPERFLPGIERHPYSYIPFSAGPRNCIGKKFALLELKTTFSAVARFCRVEPVTTEICLLPNVVLKSFEPIKVRILPRTENQFTEITENL